MLYQDQYGKEKNLFHEEHDSTQIECERNHPFERQMPR